MNHLAHALLAESTPESIIGNLSGDFVRGPVDSRLHQGVARGIRNHRHVDTYTDGHAITRRARKRFVGGQRRVAGIVLDVYFDHFLCRHWEAFSEESFSAFCHRIYTTLRIHQPLAPDRFRDFIPTFIQHDLLSSCYSIEGTLTVLERLGSRWVKKPELRRLLLRAGDDAQGDYAAIEQDFLEFFPDLLDTVSNFNQPGQDPAPPN